LLEKEFDEKVGVRMKIAIMTKIPVKHPGSHLPDLRMRPRPLTGSSRRFRLVGLQGENWSEECEVDAVSVWAGCHT
jgi:hypothetical protein